MNRYPFGVITKHAGKSFFLLDYNGDSVLDCKPELLFVPPWVVDLSSEGMVDGNSFLKIYKEKKMAFGGNDKPVESNYMKNYINAIISSSKDISSKDRIYFYFDYLYDLLYSRKEYSIAKACLLNIEMVVKDDADTRCVWLIAAIEDLYKANELDSCKECVAELVGIDNSFVPGLYYQYLLESDIENRNKLKSNLMSKYSNHWMIIDKFL